ncbi:hypothetical protein R3P38DRAFT_2816382 [Favolaschia claudopus]|uniref:Ubiquitin-like protease family profile domain-containing protein n=1 Tax=Favolaschia claudopus TaxID=2862362 RepID=A0AAV9YZ23_9AGAR
MQIQSSIFAEYLKIVSQSSPLFARETFMDLDVDDLEAAFIPADWIGKKKKYSEDLPASVIAAKNAVFSCPTSATEIAIADKNLPVLKFVDIKLPRVSSELVYGQSALWFSKDEPASDITFLRERNIPPPRVLYQLRRKSGQAWLDGAKSISDPRYNDGQDRFPLYVLTLWTEMSQMVEEQGAWKRSVEWLRMQREKCKDELTRDIIDEAGKALKTMARDAPLTYGRQSVSTIDLREFLGTVWLKTNNIDIMMEDLADRVASDPGVAGKVIVAPLAFANAVLAARKGEYTREKARLLHRYECEVKEHKKERIVFPANVANCHWIAGVIDFRHKTISFGDSMSEWVAPEERLVGGLMRWLQMQFGGGFSCEYDGLEHGNQQDNFSCGVVMENTCQRAIFPNTPLWIPRLAVRARLEHFLKYASTQVERVESKTAETVFRPAQKENEVLCEHPAFGARVGRGDHNFEDNTQSLAHGRRVRITDLLNPQDDAISIQSSESSSSRGSVVLLGKAAWSDDEASSTGGDGGGGGSDGGGGGGSDGGGGGGGGGGGDVDVDWDAGGDGYTTGGFESSERASASSLLADEFASSGDDFGPANTSSEGFSVAGDVESMGAEGEDTDSVMDLDPPPISDRPPSPVPPQTSLLGLFKGSKQTKPEKFAPPPPPKKRGRPKVDDSESESSRVPTKKKLKKERPPTPPPSPPNVGISKSSKAARELMRKLKAGVLHLEPSHPKRWQDFKDACLELDPEAEFMGDTDIQEMRRIRHSACGTKVTGRIPYEVLRFRSHCNKECPIIHKDAGMSTLKKIIKSATAGLKLSKLGRSRTTSPEPDKPCSGVTDDDIPNVQRYLRRTSAPGGGSRSVFKIAMENFKKPFIKLSSGRQEEVRDRQYHEQKWRNDHARLRVFSTSCDKTVPARKPRTLPCPPCTSLLNNRAFKRALKKQGPSHPDNYIFTNHLFRNPILGELYGRCAGLREIIEHPDAKNTPCIRYAQGVLAGKYKNEVFNGLVEAMVTKTDREERGVGMQNFKYAPAYDEFCNIIRINSPAAYRAFQEHLPSRSERSFR